jgi:hypothetical protein
MSMQRKENNKMAIWNIDEDYDENADEDLDDDLYDDEDLSVELEDDDELDFFEIKCKNCGAIIEDGYQCEVCGWLVGI